MRESSSKPKQGVDRWWKEGGASLPGFTPREKKSKGTRQKTPQPAELKHCRLHFWRPLSDTAESPYCLHDRNENTSLGLPQQFCLWEPTHCWGEPIKVIQNCDQSITDKCRWRRKRRRGQKTSAQPNTLTRKRPLKKEKRKGKSQIYFAHNGKTNVTPTTPRAHKHSLCSGMNKALHTWNFLGHHATLHYHSNPLRELHPVVSLCQAQIAPKTRHALSETSNGRQVKITQAFERTLCK